MPKRGWKDVLVRTKAEAKEDNVALLAAGVAFYALLALVPGLIALISIYGLVADPADIERNVVDALKGSPAEVQDLISSQLRSITESSAGKTLFAAIAGAAIALWSASSGMKHLISAINLAYDERETRGFLKLRGFALTLTIGAVTFLVIAFGAIALLPSLIAESDMPTAARWLIAGARWVVLLGGMLLALSILYRYAPNRENPRWSWASPGAVAATILWIVASLAFSIYTANFGSYNETYGSLGAVIVVMLWLLITAFVVILGAELNAELERQTKRDTTTGAEKPLGQRQAYAADTVGPPTDANRTR
jgi:membrane protein